MLNIGFDSSNLIMDFESGRKKKKTRRGKRCGRKYNRDGVELISKENDDGNFQLFHNNDMDILSREGNMDDLMCKIIRDKAAEISTERKSRYFSKKSSTYNFIRPCSPKAPHNSTQYLMEEHEDEHMFQLNYGNYTEDEEFYSENDKKITSSPSSTDFNCDAVNNNDQNFNLNDSFIMDYHNNLSDVESVAFMMNDFDLMYDSIRAEQLSQMSKSELINAVKNLEHEATLKERKLISSPAKSLGMTPRKTKPSSKIDSPKPNLKELLQELNKLKHENQEMRKEIEELQEMQS